ncbi:hypothetical protein PybrP1_009743 [[Pythium] brassicae (nom. inval.)]|nr:hypothetical protein PybrP1_009743 [[Pythium] brassicae (nom. inval.)]
MLVRLRSTPVLGGIAARSASSLASGSHSRSARGSRLSPSPSEPSTAPPAPLLTLPAFAYELFPHDVHCVLGLNGSGKSRFLSALQRAASEELRDAQAERRRRCRVAALSLDEHRAFVARHGERVVADVLGGVGSPNARDLIVRLGLYPVWESRVRHLSTGEMRKLMLAHTLLAVPRADVLVLDQPFDGLDAAARQQLEWMLGQLTRGFTRLLVETGGRNDAFAYRTQVLLVANRLEQVFPEILTHVVLLRAPPELEAVPATDNCSQGVAVVPCADAQEDERAQAALFERLRAFFDDEQRKRPPMPREHMVALVQELFDCRVEPAAGPRTQAPSPLPAVELRQVSIAYDRRVLLDAVDFARARHEHWALLGPNGSGKSSLMRVLMQTPGHGLTRGDVFVGSTRVGDVVDGPRHQERVGAVSTDQHIQLLHQSVLDDDRGAPTAFDTIAAHAKSPEKARVAAKLLRLPEVVNAIGTHAATATHLILITHHEDEITDCFTGMFEIRDKRLVERAGASPNQRV